MPWIVIAVVILSPVLWRQARPVPRAGGFAGGGMPRGEWLAVLARLAWHFGALHLAAREETGSADREASEARALLGVPAGATRGAINEAYRRLMRSHHPDRGGDPDAASRLNRARDCLLRHAA